MSGRFINKYAGSGATDAPGNRSKAAGIGYDTTTGAFNYNDGGVLRPLFAAGRPLPPVVVSAATLTLSPALHDGRLVVLTSLAGCAVTLPPATGSGARYQVIVGASFTSGSGVFAVANAQDYMRGFAFTTQDAGGAGVSWASANTGTVATESDTITWNRTTTGLGTIGDYVEFWDIAANIWSVETEQNSNGTEATPFSVAV